MIEICAGDTVNCYDPFTKRVYICEVANVFNNSYTCVRKDGEPFYPSGRIRIILKTFSDINIKLKGTKPEYL